MYLFSRHIKAPVPIRLRSLFFIVTHQHLRRPPTRLICMIDLYKHASIDINFTDFQSFYFYFHSFFSSRFIATQSMEWQSFLVFSRHILNTAIEIEIISRGKHEFTHDICIVLTRFETNNKIKSNKFRNFKKSRPMFSYFFSYQNDTILQIKKLKYKNIFMIRNRILLLRRKKRKYLESQIGKLDDEWK